MISQSERFLLFLVITTSILRYCDRVTIEQCPTPMHQHFYISPEIFTCKSAVSKGHFFLHTTKCFVRPPCLYLFTLVLIQANDCHPNPRPKAPKFPCQICGKACRWSKTVHSIACNNCELWYHKVCMNMNSCVYQVLENTDVSWYCHKWGIPNFNTSLFEDFLVDDSLHSSCSTPSHTPRDCDTSDIDLSSIGPPRSTSSPTQNLQQTTPHSIDKRSVRVLVVNFQSIKSRRESLWNMLTYTEPDILLASETWLHPGISEKEVLPDNYRFVARKGRHKDSPWRRGHHRQIWHRRSGICGSILLH